MEGLTSPARRQVLWTAKLRALAIRRGVDADRVSWQALPFGAGGVDADLGRAWVSVEDTGAGSAGGVMAWLAKVDPGDAIRACTVMLAPDGTESARYAPGVWARLLGYYRPDVEVVVSRPEGDEPVTADPLPTPAPPTPDTTATLDLPAGAGLEVVIEDGIVRGEVHGLEVARAVIDPLTGEWTVDVGIGRFDQEIARMMSGEENTANRIVRAADLVRLHRTPDSPRHPLAGLCRERWMRSVEWTAHDTPLGPTVPRRALRQVTVAGLLHPATDPTRVSVYTAGTDPDAVALAADLRAGVGGPAELVVPDPTLERLYRVVGRLLDDPLSFRVMSPPWSG